MTTTNDLFKDSMSVFLNYIARKTQQDSNYRPHPMIRAFECALQAIEKVAVGETAMGVSVNPGRTQDKVTNPFCVILKKVPDGIIVERIMDMQGNLQLPLELLITIFRLQIKFDKFPGDAIPTDEASQILNETLPGLHFYALGDNWKEARDKFLVELKNRHVALPRDELLKTELLNLRYDTPWEEYSPQLRALIAGFLAPELDNRPGVIVLSTPTTDLSAKYKIFDTVNQIFLGNPSKYIRGDDCKFCQSDNIRDYVLASSDYFLLLADKYPLTKGHLLLITKHHVRAGADLLEEQLREYSDLLAKIKAHYESLSISEFIFFEPGFLGQSIHHAHIHFLPGLYRLWEYFKALGCEPLRLTGAGDLIELYKKTGSYAFWGDKNEMFACGTKHAKEHIKEEWFRSIIASHNLDFSRVSWKKLAGDTATTEITQNMRLETIKAWRSN